MDAHPPKYTFEAEMRRATPGHVTVAYRLRNGRDTDLCVFNKLYRTDPSGDRTLDDNMAYVLWEEGGTVHLTRSMIDVPPGLKVEYPEVPYATILPSGGLLSEQFQVPVPLREAHPYREPPADAAARTVFSRRLYFSLGFLPRTPGLELRALPHLGQGIYAISYGDAATRQTLAKSPPVALEVSCLVSPDPR